MTWRQGRCLPYGEGITFWALGEILKAHTGILESDPPDVAQDEARSRVLPEGDGARVVPPAPLAAARDRGHLIGRAGGAVHRLAQVPGADRRGAPDGAGVRGPALGGRGDARLPRAPGRPRRGRSAAPCRAPPGPSSTSATPSTRRGSGTRPRSPSRRSRRRRPPGSSPRCWTRPCIPAELQQPILERAGGNPLYAEEFVRLLKDRDLLVRKGASWELREGAEVPFPDSVQALIAARLDTLEPEAKSLLADAAVIGKVFWAGARRGDGRARPGERRLHAARAVAQGARAPGTAVVDGRGGGVRLLARPRPRRRLQPAAPRLARRPPCGRSQRGSSRRHPSGSKTWPTCSPTTTRPPSSSPAQPGRPSRRASSRHRRLRFLALAGERALGLDTAAALASFERALALTPAGHPERAAALARFGEAAYHAGRYGEAKEALEEAISAFQAAGDRFAPPPGRWARSADVLYRLGDPRLGGRCPQQAVALLEPLPPGPELVSALTELARAEALQGRNEAGLGYAEQALTLAERARPAPARPRPRLPRPGPQQPRRPGAGSTTSGRRSRSPPRPGRAARSPSSTTTCGRRCGLRRPCARLEVHAGGDRFRAGPRAHRDRRRPHGSTLDPLVRNGEHEQALALAGELAAALRGERERAELNAMRALQARILTLRGRRHRSPTRSTGSKPPPARQARRYTVIGLAAAALARAALGQNEAAAALLAEIEPLRQPREPVLRATSPRWCAPPLRSATRSSPNGSRPGSSRAPLTPPTPA